MGIFSNLFSAKKTEIVSQQNTVINSSWRDGNAVVIAQSFNGEKTPGDMGTAKDYNPDYHTLRIRAWQSFIDSDMSKIVVSKYVKWVIGKGLKLQSQPVMKVLKDSGIKIDKEFTAQVEARFRLYCKSKRSTYSQQETYYKQQKEGCKNTIIGGDVLVVLRIDEKKNLNSQIIDATHIQSPLIGHKFFKEAENRGNKIEKGIELDKTKKHIAYIIKLDWNKYMRVETHHLNGMLSAYLVYGLRYRIDDHRGVPLYAAGMQVIKKLDRYKEASVGGAESRAKIAYSLESDVEGVGNNPLAKNTAASLGLNSAIAGGAASGSAGEKQANLMTQETGNTAFLLPPGMKAKSLESDAESNFDSFFTSNLEVFTAVCDMPLSVALSKFEGSFSAARGELKDWEHTKEIAADDFSSQFIQPFFNYWLLLEVEKGHIEAPGIFEAHQNDQLVFEAYTNARYMGSSVPHIDPVKEAKAQRILLGDSAKNAPLTTLEQATEEMGQGDFDVNIEVFKEEMKQVPQPEAPQPEEK